MQNNNWTDELSRLKAILSTCDLVETKKWGIPVYTYQGKNVVGIAGFKEHFALWFYNGVFLSDKKKVLLAAGDNTKALRQMRFSSMNEISEKLILDYVAEAIENEKAGKVWKAEKGTGITILEPLKTALNDKSLQSAWDKLTPGKQREYAEHIGTAKKEETNQARLEKCIPMILESVGLHDKYKNC